MPLLAYVAIILVSLGGILFEVNWLTSPKLETKAAVQASTSAPPKAADETPPKIANAVIAPRNVAPTVTMVPAASAPAAVAAAIPTEPAAPPAVQPAEAANQQAGTAPAISPAPFGVATANAIAPEPTGKASTEFKREFTTDVKTDDAKSASSSSATFTPAAASAPVAAVSPAAVVASSNKCDIASCSAAYQSFRATDCTYQPIDGAARKVCDRTPETAQRAATPVRDPGVDAAARKASREAELRAVEREVRRMTAREAALDDRGYGRRPGRSEVIMIERPDRDW